MWQLTQLAPALPAAWCVCEGDANTAGVWQRAHTLSTGGAIVARCGSWQSVQVTPA